MFNKILKRISPFQKKDKVEVDDWNEEKIKEISPVTHEVLEIIASCDFPFSTKDNWEDVKRAIYEPTKKILQLYRDKNLKLSDLSLISSQIRTQVERIQSAINDSLNNSSERIEEAVYGCAKRDLDFETLDNILREIESMDGDK